MAHHEDRSNLTTVRWGGVTRQAGGEETTGLSGDRCDRLPEGGERWIAQLGKEDAVKPRDLNFRRYSDFAFSKLTDDAERDEVVAADDSVRQTLSNELSDSLSAKLKRESTEYGGPHNPEDRGPSRRI